MLRLVEVNEGNRQDIRKLSVDDSQKGFLDSALGILARGYVYRSCRARVVSIADDDMIVGVALVRDLDEEPACYDLQQFMIDHRHQGKGGRHPGAAPDPRRTRGRAEVRLRGGLRQAG